MHMECIGRKSVMIDTLNLVTVQVSRKKIGRNSRFFEKKLPCLAYLFIFLSLKVHFRVFPWYDNKTRFSTFYQTVVMQSDVDMNQINSNFQVFSRPQQLHCLSGSQIGPQ